MADKALIRNEIVLKNGQTLKNPSLFLELRSKNEGKLVKETNFRYPLDRNAHDGINQIDGFNISICNFSKVAPYLTPDLKSAFGEDCYSMNERICLIDPSLYFLFMGSASDKKKSCEIMGNWVPSLSSILENISSVKSQRIKLDMAIRDIYPLLDIVLTRNLLEYQIKHNASILINPSVPLSSSRRIISQVEKMREMNRTGRVLLDTLLTRYKTKRDLMNMAVLNPSVLTSANRDNVIDAMLQGRPDLLGIRLMNLDEQNTSVVNSFLQFIKDLSRSGKPIFVFNVREFGYVTYCYDSSVISMPIAKSPYTTRKKGSEPPVREGSYYHSINMVDYSYARLPEEIRGNNYRFPCHCEICQQFGSFLKIDKKQWNYFRKVHFLLLKNMEMQELRKTEVPLNVALKDKFGRSKKTAYIPFLP